MKVAIASVVAVFHLLASVQAAGGGIYPEGHWTRSVKLRPDNFEATVASEIESGRTFFVRWIASEG